MSLAPTAVEFGKENLVFSSSVFLLADSGGVGWGHSHPPDGVNAESRARCAVLCGVEAAVVRGQCPDSVL